MAVPLNTFTPSPIPSTFLPPLSDIYTPLTMRCPGGTAIGNATDGRETQNWTVSYDTSTHVVSIVPDSTGASATLTIPGILVVSLAFDNAMAVTLAYMKSDGGYLYYFDSIANAHVTTYFSDVRSCRIAVDKTSAFFSAQSDIIFGFVNSSNQVKYRQQRDRYATEYLVGTAAGTLTNMGPTVGNRLQFLVQQI